MAEPELDPVIHAQLRLRIVALLAVVDEAEFARVRDEVGVSDSVLSKHLSALAAAGYVSNRKTVGPGRRTTWLSLTRKGRKALKAHVAALRALIDPLDTG